MSYDIYLKDPATNEIIQLPQKHEITGGTYCLGGTPEAWLNVTYNYATHFYRVMGKEGIRTISGMTGLESLPVLGKAISKLAEDCHTDYWEPTEGNARRALCHLAFLAIMAPDGIWDGD